MATELKKVQPGELIKSDLINLMIDQLLALGTGPAGTVTVPNLFGRTLSEATTIIEQPQINLQLSNVVDAFGTSVDPDLIENKPRLIINQVPDPGVRVNPGSLIDLLVAAKPGTSGTGTGTSTKPTINTVNPFNPAKIPIGQDVAINGNNFALDRTKNKVTFDGVPAVGDPTPESSKNKLVVKVPVVPNPPPAGKEKEVTVIVTTPDGGSSEPAKLLVLPALAGENPTITKIDSSAENFARVGEVITINGTGFSETQGQNQVNFDTVITFPETSGSQPGKLSVKVPAISGAVGPTDFVDVSIFVTVGGKKSNVIGPFTIGGKQP